MSAIRSDRALGALRLLLAMLLLIHGIARWRLDGVEPFGQFLSGQGFGKAGWLIAWFVTLYELSATWLLAFGPKRLLVPISSVFVAIYTCGVWLVHWPQGWFVVGAGRNGMEYSILLIGCLLLLIYTYWPDFRARRRTF